MDSSNVAMVHLIMKESAFEHFFCDMGLTIGLNMESLHKVFRLCGPSDKATMVVYRVDEKTLDNKVYFTFESASEERCATFSMNTIKIELEPTAVPEPDSSLMITLPA